ncbi:glutaredoxin family protein [Lentibacillus halophilus]|uniref:Glutaredoxin family protein n=1 Tax=Lentibacillus halophilus TaxID=295065 RepID=A0ABN0ZGC7_9BACI
MRRILFYTKAHCPLCDEVEAILDLLQRVHPFDVEVRDIETCDEWLEAYQMVIPVVEIEGRTFAYEAISYDVLDHVLQESTAN